MLAVSVDRHDDDLSQTWIEGFVTKREFYLHKRIADGINRPRLTKDTWYLPKKCLHPLPRGQRLLPHELLARTLIEMMACKTKPAEAASAIKNNTVAEFVTGGEWVEMWDRPFDRPELIAGNGDLDNYAQRGSP
jgi:hypothetical protein